ncbi:hypothetical protein NWI01_33200 [Nitrobacter winogradskyi]|uniref:DUF58 domain-containing protein n=1 Tax=Nitrobacter winogradskyi TaxID=913 RepID=A0A4Y3WFX6_NITWI|nr:DUF58 domain-containing protein [Nitrobacter winogradskyi]GEC17428.1 hypothetical protein NWI01_33200 [Nitrobacter winogradskyi]
MTKPASDDGGVYVDLVRLISLERKGRRVSLLPRQPVSSLLSGRNSSRLRGRGLNFEEIRDYRSGDDVRSIDWKVTARLRRPHVRVFKEERDRQAILVIDQRLSMFFGSKRAMKSVTAAEMAAVIAWRILNVGDRVGAIVFNDSGIVEVRPRRSRQTVLQILSAIVSQNRQLGVGRGISSNVENLNTALSRVRQLAPHDATIVVISDFFGVNDATRGLAAAITQHNDVIAVLVHDPLQSELPDSGRITVTDGELQIALDARHGATRRSILGMSKARLHDVLTWSRQLGIPVLPLNTAEEPLDQLQKLLGLLPQNTARGGHQSAVGGGHG